MEAHRAPGLYVREPGGGFYARITLNGKRTWRSLDTEKIREAQKRLRDLQSGHTRQVSTRSDDKLHAAIAKVMEFRSIRRGINRPIKARTAGYHQEILGITKKLSPDRPLRIHRHRSQGWIAVGGQPTNFPSAHGLNV